MIAILWLADILAYFSGRAFGYRKLESSISLGYARIWWVFIGVLMAYYWFTLRGGTPLSYMLFFYHDIYYSNEPIAYYSKGQIYWWWGLLLLHFLMLLICLTVLIIFGGLFESLLKRQEGIKGSSALLPKYGGGWDRIGRFIPVLPFIALCVMTPSLRLPVSTAC